MTAQYAFFFDARYCSGCKACQAACKDKNNLPTGVLWRRVIEVSGGTWQQHDHAWKNSVFAYNLSLACNHCVHPKCAGVCPTGAYSVREDGIVILDPHKCVGCGYCAWACPYGVPQYNPEAGHMTKCNFCFDQLEQGLPPACVAACPLRALDYGDMETQQGLALWNIPSEAHPYPLPSYSHTQPRLAIKPHPAMSTRETKNVANLEEIQTRVPSKWEDLPLILFTLLAQMAVGGFLASVWMFGPLWSLVEYDATGLRLLPSLLVGICLSTGMIASLAHLGTKKNAWRVFGNLRRSRLSREILFTILFGSGWLLTTTEIALLHRSGPEWQALTAILGLGLIYNMSEVYRLPAAPGWNTWRTNAGFFISAMLLGTAMMVPILAYESNRTGIQISSIQFMQSGSIVLILLLLQLALIYRRISESFLQNVRVKLLLLGVALTVLGIVQFTLNAFWISSLIFVVVLAEELLGRWLFYQSRI